MSDYGERHMYQVQWIGVPEAAEFSDEAVALLVTSLRFEGAFELADFLED